MRVSALAHAAIFGLALAGCAPTPAPRATDTGNMAYPAPQPQGDIGSTSTAGQRRPMDTGNMAYPAPEPQGNVSNTTVGRQRRPTDTGNMAFPAPLPQGNVETTRVR